MSLSAGTRLGPYAVTAKIGEGGKGEVYQARDTKLDRDVALKALPEAFTSDPDRLPGVSKTFWTAVGQHGPGPESPGPAPGGKGGAGGARGSLSLCRFASSDWGVPEHKGKGCAWAP